MDLEAQLEDRYRGLGQWSQTAYVHPKANKHSIHRSQLDSTKDKIRRLHVLNGDGTTMEFGEPNGKLKLSFTGGTDDPSIEISLRQFSAPSLTESSFPTAIIYKFSAYPTSKSDVVYNGRKVEDFWPEKTNVEFPASDDFLDPTSFTDELYDLRLERFVENDTACLRLSWKSKKMAMYGLSLATQADQDHFELARLFCDIAEKQKESTCKGQTFTIEVLDNPVVQYRYRYLLACRTDLQAYWRYRLLPDVDHGAVPVDLCELLPLRSREVQELESPDPEIKISWDSEKWFPRNTYALAPVYAFSSIAQVEFYVKGALLYEEHAVSHLRKRFLHPHWDIEFEELRQGQDDSSSPIWVAILKAPPESTRAVRPEILPKEGSAVTLRWQPQGNKKSKINHWMGLLLKSEVGFKQRVRLAVLVWPYTSSPTSAKLLAQTHRPSFDFSIEANNLGFVLNSMDKLLFLDATSQANNPAATRILDALMARDNRKEMDEAPSTMANNHSMSHVTSHLDKSQETAMSRLSEKRITLIDGPEASGKTMLAAIFGAQSIRSGEKVTFLARTKTSLKKLFLKVIEVAKDLQLPSTTIEQFNLTENAHPLPTEETALEKMLSKVEWTNMYGFSTPVKATARMTTTKSVYDAPTAQFTTYEELDSLNLGGFDTTLLICIEAERAPDHSIFAACGLFSGTLKKVALFGNSNKIPCDVTSRELNHLRSQLELTTFWRLICTGIDPVKLTTQHRMDPDVSAVPARHLYWARSQLKRVVSDGVETAALQDRHFIEHWVANYLDKEVKDAKLAVFANVTDGVCLQDAKGFAKANHHNMLAILDILQSMISLKLPRENIILVTFFPEAAIAMREFLTSQGLLDIRIEHLDSDNISAEENLITIIDCPMTGLVSLKSSQSKKGESKKGESKEGECESLSVLHRAQRLASALCIPSALRIFVGNASLAKAWRHGWNGSQGQKLIKDLVKSHKQDAQVKNIKIGDRLLEYQKVLRPEDYVFAFDTTKPAMEMYEEIAEQQKKAKQNSTGKSEIGQAESTRPESTISSERTGPEGTLSSAVIAAATGVEADACVGQKRGKGGDDVERDLASKRRRRSI